MSLSKLGGVLDLVLLSEMIMWEKEREEVKQNCLVHGKQSPLHILLNCQHGRSFEASKTLFVYLNLEHHLVVILKGVWLLNCLFSDIK